VVDSGASKTGKQSVKLWIKDADEVCLAQKIAIKPSTRYLLSAWVRTKDVVLGAEATVGAQLEIDGHVAGGSIAGSQEWTFVTSEFSSEDRREVEVAVRLGAQRSVSSGSAWFDGVSLVEIPAKADKGTAENKVMKR
jgi:hypothetical protein